MELVPSLYNELGELFNTHLLCICMAFHLLK